MKNIKAVIAFSLLLVMALAPTLSDAKFVGNPSLQFSAAPSNFRTFDFSQSNPEFTYTRNDANATYRDDSGVPQVASTDQLLVDHDYSGNFIGLRFDPPSTNKCTNTNLGMTDLTGISVGGNASGTVTVGTHPVLGFPTIVIDNTLGGSGTKFATITDCQFGNTNAHSMRAEYYVEAKGGGAWINTSGGENTTVGTADTGENGDIRVNNLTPVNATRSLQLNAGVGAKIHYWLWQVEELPYATAPIRVAGASASRARPVMQADVSSASWFSTTEGAIMADVIYDHLGDTDQYAFLASQGSGLNNAAGMYITGGSAQARGRFAIEGSNKQVNDIHRPIQGKRFPMGIAWQNNQNVAVAGAMSNQDVTSADGSPVGMNELTVGGREFTQTMIGWIPRMVVYNEFRTLAQMGADMFPPTRTYRAVVTWGQSNQHGYHRSQVGQGNAGETRFVAELDEVWTGSENWLIHGASNGSRVIDRGSDDNWWYDLSDTEFGPLMDEWKARTTAFGISRIEAIIGDQGESDSNASLTDIKAAWSAIYGEMHTHLGSNLPVSFTKLGRRSDNEAVNYNVLRQASNELETENAWYYNAPEKFIHPLVDVVHLTDAGYGTAGAIHGRFVLEKLGGLTAGTQTPPSFSAVSRTGTTVDLDITHSAGTDFTPTTGIEGFRYFDGASEVTISSAVRLDADTIRITLASEPSGSNEERLYYAYGTMIGNVANFTSFVRDNSAYQLPLYHINEVVTVAGAGVDIPTTGLVMYLDASDRANVTESGGTITSWADSSGNSHSANQATVGNQPTYEENVQNSLGCVLADDTDDQMFVTNTATLGAIDTEMTISLLIDVNPSGSFELITSKRDGALSTGFQLQDDGANEGFFRIDNGSGNVYNTTPRQAIFGVGTPQLVTLRLDDGTADMWVNGTQVVTAASYTVGDGFGNSIDLRAVGSVGGHYCSYALYNTALSNGDISTLHSTLSTKWGLGF